MKTKEHPCPLCTGQHKLEDFSQKHEWVQVRFWPFEWQGTFWRRDILGGARDEEGRRIGFQLELEWHGDLIRTVLDDAHFEPRWQGFAVEVFGYQAMGDPPGMAELTAQGYYGPPSPFFFSEVFTVEAPDDEDESLHGHRTFYAARITHKDSDLSLLVHWWPTHGRLVELRGTLPRAGVRETLAAMYTALEFFQRETRGNAKLNDDRVKGVLHELGPDTTQVAAAEALNVSERALEKWRARRGLSTWQEVIEQFLVVAK